MTTIGYATLQIIPSLKGVSSAIDKELRGQTAKVPFVADEQSARRAGQRSGKAFSDAAERETRGMGTKIGDFFDPSPRMASVGRAAAGALKGAMLAGVAGVGAVIAGTVGGALVKGFDRLKSIDEAQAKLRGLGNSAADVQKIMDSALASVKGTAFGLGDAATIAANAVAAGVKPGEELTKYLKMTADASAIAGTNLGDMGQIINQVRTGQKAYTDDLNQLADRGIPIYQWLAEEAGVAAGDVKKLAAEGGISAQMFEASIQKHIGGAALTMGTSFSGAVQNAEAALGRLGAAFLQPVFVNAAGGLGSVTSGLDGLTNWITNNQDKIVGFWETMGSVAITGAENFAHGIGGALQALGDLIGGLGNVKGVLDDTMAFFAELRGDDAGAEAFRKSAQEAYGWGESIRAAGDKLVNLDLEGSRAKLHNWADAARDADTAARNATTGGIAGLGSALGALPNSKNIDVTLNTAEAERKWQEFKNMLQNPPTPTVNVRPGTDALSPEFFTPRVGPPIPPGGGRATGGAIFGAGSATSDSIPAWLSNGEHVFTADDVRRMGGQGAVYAFRSALHRAGGGIIDWISLGSAGGGPNLKGPGVGDIGQRIDSPIHPENPTWGDMRPGTIPGDNWRPRGVFKNHGGIEPWWAFPGDPIKTPGGVYGIDPMSPDWKRRRNIFGDSPWTGGSPDARIPNILPGDPWRGKGPRQYADGGAVGDYIDVRIAGGLVGTSYSQAKRTDCSGMVARVINGTLGLPNEGLMSTKNAQQWLAERGFVPGIGGPGQISVGWYDHGPNPNDGHMAMTLSDGSHAEAGGGVGDIFQIGGGAAGATDPKFDQHMYLPTLYGEGPAGSSAASSPFAGGSASAAVTGAPPSSSGGGGGTASSSGGGGFGGLNLPSSLDGFGSWAGGKLGDLAKLGEAAGSLVDGQVASALDVFGVPSSPGWLQGISQFIGGISIGGGDGATLPLTAGGSGSGTTLSDDPGNMHGNRAGQAPGPTYNITARDTEDAFVKAQRVEREKAAAKLSRF